MQQIRGIKEPINYGGGIHGISTVAVCTGDVFHVHSAATL